MRAKWGKPGAGGPRIPTCLSSFGKNFARFFAHLRRAQRARKGGSPGVERRAKPRAQPARRAPAAPPEGTVRSDQARVTVVTHRVTMGVSWQLKPTEIKGRHP